MSHTIREKQRLLNRVRRIRGQIDAVERALIQESDCNEVLQLITSCRGAMNGLLTNVLEDHIRTHLVEAEDEHLGKHGDAREQLISVVRSYFK
ncbi:metal/formaldehyde-sensitive transcriptional repressor [Undibacterium sp. MH2W]|uniref:metal/formaldehyde-sensitive transcriptional repressor n=1 Tax=Undibacterium sp. MH2W TaxID=3413044 RepID=UPI003BF42AF6